ncbi:hypothetical protein PybrP1_008234 [[Pythium] brassicae (nom. inval.)]|nr:hypothetical protein PybrP1_008234 [[Pythium] brassicae (nom. inval.)]
MACEYFRVRKLIWDEMKQHVKPASVPCALTLAFDMCAQELARELAVVVEILSEFQQQNDNIRDALLKRVQVPEPPGRSLLLEKLKLLARDVRSQSSRAAAVKSCKENELLEYVLSEVGAGSDARLERCPSTPRMADLPTPRFDAASSREADSAGGVAIRPGTSSGRRPPTASSQRPVSRGSTLSVSSTASSLLESPELRKRLNVEEIDAILGDLQDALVEERQQLLEDIEFIQGCLEMENDLIDDDRRNVRATPPPPSLHELSDLCRSLERALEEQHEIDKVESIFSKMSDPVAARLVPVPALSAPAAPRPPPRSGLADDDDKGSSQAATKVLRIRHVIQEARDEPFLS